VVNYDFPSNIQQYVHRIGRCGRRQGAEGHAFSFITRNYMWMAPTLVRLLRSCKQNVDPNLLQLANESGEFDDDMAVRDGSSKQPITSDIPSATANSTATTSNPATDGNDDDDDDDYFPDDDDDDGPRVTLSGNRI